MFYTLAGAVKATGLPELAILRALQGGEITGTKDLFGEWQIEHTELQGLYPPIAKRDANKDAVQDYVAIDATALEAEIGALIWQAGDSLRQQRENGPEPNTGGDQTQASQNLIAEPNHATLWSATSTITPAWDHSIRIDDRDKISVSVLAPAAPRTRTALIAGALLLALSIGWIGGSNSDHLLGHRPVSTSVEQKPNSPAHIFNSEKPMMSLMESHRQAAPAVPNTGKIATATAAGIGRQDKSTQGTAEIPSSATNKISAVAQQPTATSELTAAAIKRRTKTLPRPLPAPETRPTTIEGWTVRDVIDGTAVLQGPGGIWKAASGEMVPGLGRVDSIVLWGSRWIVATSKGLITTQ